MIRQTCALLFSLACTLPAAPALAHPGDHNHMSALQLIQHYAEPDHLAFLAIAAIVGWLGYRLGVRQGARAEARHRSKTS